MCESCSENTTNCLIIQINMNLCIMYNMKLKGEKPRVKAENVETKM